MTSPQGLSPTTLNSMTAKAGMTQVNGSGVEKLKCDETQSGGTGREESDKHFHMDSQGSVIQVK